MPFKANASFLKFLTMGVEGARATIRLMRASGFEPIELERYCTSNKIWANKVKRLRLPDLLCLKTGIRVEVRAKSDLAIRMSDAPENPERTWDAGMRDEDVAALVACAEESDGRIVALGHPNFFTFGDLRAVVGTSKLGPPKASGEGAERDRTWPSCTPGSDGEVLEVTAKKITTRLASGRAQTYQLEGKVPRTAYVRKGDRFVAGATIIAGVVPRKLDIQSLKTRTWNPMSLLGAREAIDRYAASKALGYSDGSRRDLALTKLHAALAVEKEPRVKLEIAGAIARLEADQGVPLLRGEVDAPDRPDLRMEAVLILTELGTRAAAKELRAIASAAPAGDELKQAAVWGLGQAGAKDYDAIIPFLADQDADVRLHAIAAFGRDTSEATIRKLVGLLNGDNAKVRASASEVLRLVGGSTVLSELVKAARAAPGAWTLVTLGRMPPEETRRALGGDPLLDRIDPLLTSLSVDENWVASKPVAESFQFLLAQVPQAR